MNQEKLMASGINYAEGLKRFSGKVPIYEKYLKQFMDDSNFLQLEKEMQDGAYAEAFETAHALKGVTGTLSIEKLYAVFCELVEALRGNDTEKAEHIMPQVTAEYQKIMGILRDACAE